MDWRAGPARRRMPTRPRPAGNTLTVCRRSLPYVGALDLFRDETLELVRKLAADGVPTTFTLYPGCFHAFDLYVPDAQVSRRAREALHTYIQSVFQSVS